MILDYHLELVLQAGYKKFVSDQAKFNYMFPGVAPAVLTEWWTAFKNSPPSIGTSFARGVKAFPLILVRPGSDDVEERPMGDQVFKDTDNRMVGNELLSQSVTLVIIAQSPMMMRIWYTVVYHLLFTATRDLIEAGYEDVVRESADDFTVDDESLAEQYGLAAVVTRSVQVRARLMTHVKYWDTVHTAKGWYVLPEDQQTLDGHPGGVVPSSGT
jgi:hypothetical protein